MIPPVVEPTGVELVGKVTGEDSPNRTGSRFGFLATDLGVLWDDGAGGVLAAFGDTYGEGWTGPGAGARSADHRRNVLARCAGGPLEDGLGLESVVEDRPGHAAEILPGRRWPSRLRLESTVIPNAGTAVDGVQYLHYMSVRRWGRPGNWRTNHGGIARSADGGATWEPAGRGARWPNPWWTRGRRPFQLGAFARPPDGSVVYLFGARNGRFGPVYLARVDPGQVAAPGSYEYWTGKGWERRVSAARPVTDGPAGELSVAFHHGLGVWLMVHLDDPGARIALRAADRPTGPWSDGVTLLSGAEHPGLYGGYLHPGALHGEDIYFTVSRWDPYNVYLARARLHLNPH